MANQQQQPDKRNDFSNRGSLSPAQGSKTGNAMSDSDRRRDQPNMEGSPDQPHEFDYTRVDDPDPVEGARNFGDAEKPQGQWNRRDPVQKK